MHLLRLVFRLDLDQLRTKAINQALKQDRFEKQTIYYMDYCLYLFIGHDFDFKERNYRKITYIRGKEYRRRNSNNLH